MATPEGKTKDLIKKYLKANDLWFKMITPSAFGSSTGISDFQILKNGKFIVIEAKRGDKPSEPTANQIDYMDKVMYNGGLAFLVRNADDIAEMDKILKSEGII